MATFPDNGMQGLWMVAVVLLLAHGGAAQAPYVELPVPVDALGQGIAASSGLVMVGRYIYRQNASGAWEQEATLPYPGGTRPAEYGWSVALSNEMAAVVWREAGTIWSRRSGVSLFTYSNEHWESSGEIIASLSDPYRWIYNFKKVLSMGDFVFVQGNVDISDYLVSNNVIYISSVGNVDDFALGYTIQDANGGCVSLLE